ARLIDQMGGTGVHRSCPHDREWPNLTGIAFDAAVVMTRDWTAAIESQLHAGHVEDRPTAEEHLQRAYPHLLRQLERLGRPWRLVSYEALILHQAGVLAGLAAWLGLNPGGVLEPVTDENTK